MTTTVQNPDPARYPAGADIVRSEHYSWAAVFAGFVTSFTVNLLFAEAWMGMGLSVVDTQSHAGTIVVASAIAWVIGACIALYVGGWVAGRVARTTDATVSALQGLGVWSSAAIATVADAAVIGGTLFGTTALVAGKGVEAAGSAVGGAASGAGSLASGAAQIAAPNIDNIRGWLNDAEKNHTANARSQSNQPQAQNAQTTGAPADTQAQNQATGTQDQGAQAAPGLAQNQANANPTNGAQQNAQGAPAAGGSMLADQSRLSELLAAHFSTDGQPIQGDADRKELTALIASRAGISQDDAAKALAQWDHVWTASVDKWNHAKDEARAAAEQARRLAAQAAIWSVVAMILGALAAIAGSLTGIAGRTLHLQGQLPRSDRMGGYPQTAR